MITVTRGIAAIAVAIVSTLTAGCLVGPNYKRPSATPPDTFRDATPTAGAGAGAIGAAAAASATSIGDAKWWEVFQDDQLQTLIRTGLVQNFDLRIAATRILQAEAQLGITRADQYPRVNGSFTGLGQRARAAGINDGNPVTGGAAQVLGSASWALDFWGQYRRATEAAQAQLLATRWGQRAVMTTLVSQLANAYFDLRSLDMQL